MGWGSAGAIFDPIAQALIDLGADDRIKRGVLGPLIGRLQDEDWDTEDESLDAFADDPVIVELFHQAGVGTRLWSRLAEGGLGWTGDGWELGCDSRHGYLAAADGTPAGHDELVRLWAEHERDHHGGDGTVQTAALINKAVAS